MNCIKSRDIQGKNNNKGKKKKNETLEEGEGVEEGDDDVVVLEYREADEVDVELEIVDE